MIQNRKFIRAHVFALALLLMLLFSLSIGIVGGKPGKVPPGKPPRPPPEPETSMFRIWIEGPDVVLDSPEYLEVEAYVDTCGWYPPKKGTKAGGWGADLNSFVSPGVECGDYKVDLPEMDTLEIDATSFSIARYWDSRPVREFNKQRIDFWELYIHWMDTANTPYLLRVWTDWNAEQEGTYDPGNDMWTVDFSDASFEYGHAEEGYVHWDDSGTLELGFTVTIEKGDLVP